MPASVDLRVSHSLGLAAVCAVVGVSWSAAYLPNARRLRDAQTQRAQLNQQLQQTEPLLARAGGEAAWLAAQHQRLTDMQARFLTSREVPRLLDRVVERVNANQLALVDVNQGNLTPATDANGNALTMSQTPCLSLPVTLTVQGRYRAVTTLLEHLVSREFPSVVTVDSVHLVLDDSATGALTATIDLVLYVLGS